MDKKLSKEEYLEILKLKREAGVNNFSDLVFYKGKAMGKCPPGTMRSGKTCVPKVPSQDQQILRQKTLGGINPQQAKLLGQAKSQRDIRKSRESM